MKNRLKLRISGERLHNNIIAYIFGIIPLAFIVISGCSKDNGGDPVGPEEPAVVISDNLYIIDPGKFIGPTINNANYTFTFQGDPPEVAAGDVILGTVISCTTVYSLN